MSKYNLCLSIIMLAIFGFYAYLVITSVPNATSLKLGLGNDIIRFAISFTFALPLFLSFYFGCLSARLLFLAKFNTFSKAISILTLILLFNSLVGQIRSHYFPGEDVQKIFTIITNYLYTFGHLIGFYLIFIGTKELLPAGFKRWNIIATFIVIILISVFYSLMLVTNPDRTVSTIPGALASHYLSDQLIFLTIFLPTVIGWFLAIVSAFSLIEVFSIPTNSEKDQGSRQILYGLLALIFSDIILQVIVSIGTKRVLDIGLPLVLGILYVFVAVLVAGNFLIMIGARKYIKKS